MLYKLVLGILKKHYNKFSLEQKKNIRKLVNGKTIDENAKGNKNKRGCKMEKETKQEEQKKVETENNEVEKEKETEQGEDEKKIDGENTTETDTEKETETTEETETTDENPAEQVIDTPPTGNGIRVEDLVTIDMLNDKLSALIAKFEAVVKENTDLKEELDKKGDELSNMQDKYENKNFGGMQKRGAEDKGRTYANDSFEEYAKQFM